MTTSEAKPRLRGMFHMVAFFLSLPAAVYLTSLAKTSLATLASSIYSASLIAMFGASALYHRGRWQERTRKYMKRLDHTMIFLLIAGTYTPIGLLVLDQFAAKIVLSIVWLGALIGITLKVAVIDGRHAVTAALHIGLGWTAMGVLPQLAERLSLTQMVLLFVGGFFYTVGAIMFALRWPNPWPDTLEYHEVWHVFMTTAALAHWIMIALILSQNVA